MTYVAAELSLPPKACMRLKYRARCSRNYAWKRGAMASSPAGAQRI